MSALIGLLFYIFLFWFIVKLMRSKKNPPGKTSPAVNGRPSNRNTPVQKPARAHSRTPQPVQNDFSDLSADPSNPEAYFGEGEDPEEHKAHLMQSAQEGESEEEHAAHMRAADAHTAVPAVSSHSPASALKSDAASLRRAVVMSEVLGRPAAFRSSRFDARH